MSKVYNETFYQNEGALALTSAEIILPMVLDKLKCKSIVDFGCGTGEWINIAQKYKDDIEILGLDGEYARQYLIIDENKFQGTDLTREINLGRKFDMAISLEVAEHIEAAYADQFVHNLVKHADVILFSAAIPNQGGINHVNEQYPTYWEEKFKMHGYAACDCLRSLFWNDKRIAAFYRQNMIIYCKRELKTDIQKVFDCDKKLLNLVHPELFENRLKRRERQFLFPFEKVPANSRVIIYGAGRVGKAFVNQLKVSSFAQIAAWCDKNYRNYEGTDYPVISLNDGLIKEYDYIVIAVNGEEMANEIRNELLGKNIPQEKIIWRHADVIEMEYK